MPESPDPTLIDTHEAEQEYHRYLTEAQALEAGQVVPFRADANLALHNVKLGLAELLPRLDEVAPRFPAADVTRMRTLDRLALGTVFAVSQVNRLQERSPGDIAKLVRETYDLRRVLLWGAEACAEAKLIPEAEVEKIRQGRGKLDSAQDCIDLAALYRKHAAELTNRTPATKEMIDRAAAVGTELVMLLKPQGASRDKQVPESVKKAAELRDRFWTLLVEGHEKLWQAGALVFGRKVDDHVPALQSRAR